MTFSTTVSRLLALVLLLTYRSLESADTHALGTSPFVLKIVHCGATAGRPWPEACLVSEGATNALAAWKAAHQYPFEPEPGVIMSARETALVRGLVQQTSMVSRRSTNSTWDNPGYWLFVSDVTNEYRIKLGLGADAVSVIGALAGDLEASGAAAVSRITNALWFAFPRRPDGVGK